MLQIFVAHILCNLLMTISLEKKNRRLRHTLSRKKIIFYVRKFFLPTFLIFFSGVELIDFTEDQEEEEEEEEGAAAEGIFARGSRDRAAEALQAVMWTGMQRKTRQEGRAVAAVTQQQALNETIQSSGVNGDEDIIAAASVGVSVEDSVGPGGELDEALLHDLRRVRESIAGEEDPNVRRRRAEEVTLRLMSMLGLYEEENGQDSSEESEDDERH